MRTNHFLNAALVGVLFLGLVAFGPASASAATMWNQQALLLAHIPLGGGQFFTSNYVFTATENATTINVKCFNDNGNRIGPLPGINIAFSAQSQLAQHTPTTLGVASDPLFSSGTGWCWASSPGAAFDFNVQATFGVTTDLTVGGVLNSSGASFIGTTTGLAETGNGNGGVPFWTTSGGAQHFLVLVNPLTAGGAVNLRLFDSGGVAQGTGTLARTLNARSLLALSVPSGFGLPTPPTTGSIRITGGGGDYLGWYLQVFPNGRAILAPVGLDADGTTLLPLAAAP